MPKRNDNKIKVVELFAGVGGFRIGLEGASDAYDTIWNNQWEPSTVHQDASLVYRARFGSKGHCNKDINTVPTDEIPNHDLLVGGFPCQIGVAHGAEVTDSRHGRGIFRLGVVVIGDAIFLHPCIICEAGLVAELSPSCT